MLLLKFYILVLTISLASTYLSTILIHRTAFLIFIISPLFSDLNTILGGLFQTTLLSQIPNNMGDFSFLEESNIFLLCLIPTMNINVNSDKSKFIKDLTPEFKQWFTGFFDAEGCFFIQNRQDNSIRLMIKIVLHIDELPLLKFLQTKLTCGVISKGKNICQLSINKQSDLNNIIIPILEEFPLNTTKYLNYINFKEALNIVQNKGHLTTNGKLEILKLKANMNRSRTNYEMPSNHSIRITPSWLLGFVEGDGSFTTTKSMPFLSIAQSTKDIIVLKKISEYLNSGTLQEQKITNRYKDEQPMVRLIFQDIIFLHNTLLPLFDSLEFYSKKQLDYKDWVIIVKLYYSGIHLYPQGEKLINDLKMNMNNNRLSTNKNIEDKPVIAQEEINKVLLLEPLYHLVGSRRVHIKSNKPLRSGRTLKVIAKNIDNSSIEFYSIKETSEFFKCHTDTISRRINTDRLYLNKWRFYTN